MLTEFIDIKAVVFTAIISFILGALWYGPLFGKMWAKLSKLPALEIAKARKKGMLKQLIINFLGTFIMVYVFAGLVSLTGIVTPIQGAIFGFWLWLGFFACTTLLNSVLWEHKPWELYVLNALYWLVNLMLVGFLIVAWS